MATENVIRDQRGIATSLIETVVVIAIIAIISSVALVSAMDRIEDARIARALADTEMIAISIHSFMHDTGFVPAYKKGDARGLEDAIYLVLETAGNDPAAAPSLGWPPDAKDRDRIENHLIRNRPGDTTVPYPMMGEIAYARQKGWNGPYLQSAPLSDPWGNRYLVNVQLLTSQGVMLAAGGLPLSKGQRAAVFAVSAGPNQLLETRFDQIADSFITGGDDIIFRIQ